MYFKAKLFLSLLFWFFILLPWGIREGQMAISQGASYPLMVLYCLGYMAGVIGCAFTTAMAITTPPKWMVD